MRIGILTLNYKVNYGGILQMMSLYSYLKNLGHDVEIINFVRKEKKGRIKTIFQRIVNFLTSESPIKSLKDKNTEDIIPRRNDSDELISNNIDFINSHFVHTKEVNENNISEVAVTFDAVIAGSDQIWSVTTAKNLSYFFDWDYSGRKIVYAACSVKSKPYYFNRRKISRLLKSLDTITVRDSTTQCFVSSTCGIEPSIVCDPTLLVDFVPLVGEPIIKGKYIFLYILGGDIIGGGKKVLQKIKNKVGNIPIVSAVLPSISTVGEQLSDISYDKLNPIEWLNLLFYSTFVYTDSFHGAIYSIHYNKDFVAYYKSYKRASRLIDLVHRFGLENHLINEIANDIEIPYPTKFDVANIIMTNFVEESKDILIKSLK